MKREMENKLITKLKSHLKKMEEEDQALREETRTRNAVSRGHATQEPRTVQFEQPIQHEGSFPASSSLNYAS